MCAMPSSPFSACSAHTSSSCQHVTKQGLRWVCSCPATRSQLKQVQCKMTNILSSLRVCTPLCRHVEPAQAVCGDLLSDAGRVALRIRVSSDSGCVRPFCYHRPVPVCVFLRSCMSGRSAEGFQMPISAGTGRCCCSTGASLSAPSSSSFCSCCWHCHRGVRSIRSPYVQCGLTPAMPRRSAP